MQLAHRILAQYGPPTADRPISLGPELPEVREQLAELAPHLGPVGLYGSWLHLGPAPAFAADPRLSADELSVCQFDAIWTENRHRLPLTKSYPVNREAVRKWRSKLPPELEFFGRLVATGLTYVGFAQFVQHLDAAADEAIAACAGKRILLAIDADPRVSGFWSALLVWPRIRKHVGAVILRTELRRIAERRASDWLVVLVDDASYSGQQMVMGLRRRTGAFSFFVLVAALSTAARTRLVSEMPAVLLPKTAILIKSVREIADEYGGAAAVKELEAQLSSSENVATFAVELRHHLLYFGHKLADSLSVANRTIALAPVEVQNAIVSFGSMISGCELAEYGDGFRSVVGPPVDVPGATSIVSAVDDFSPYNTCPRPFYKSINYTMGGARLDELALARLFH